MLTNEQNLILQTFITVELFGTLKKNNFIKSEYFNKELEIEEWLKTSLNEINIDNQGSLLMSFYAMLVVPKELIGDSFSSKFENINEFLKNKLDVVEDTYTHNHNVKYIKHIRNAVAHARVEFLPNEYVIFEDKSGDAIFKAKMKLSDVGSFMEKLRTVHINYSERINSN